MRVHRVHQQEVSVVGLPDLMPAAVYRGHGLVEVDHLPGPASRARRGSGGGLALRGLWVRPAHDGRGLGKARDGGRSRDRRAWSRQLARRSRSGRLGDRVIVGPSPRCGTCRQMPRGKALSVRAARADGIGTGPYRRVRRVRDRERRGALADARRHVRARLRH